MICTEICISPQLWEENISFWVNFWGAWKLKEFQHQNAVRFLNLDFVFLLTFTIDELMIETLGRLHSITEMKWLFKKESVPSHLSCKRKFPVDVSQSIYFLMIIYCSFFMYMNDYLIKTAHYFCRGKIVLLATHQMLTRVLCHPLIKANTKICQPRERKVAILTQAERTFYSL